MILILISRRKINLTHLNLHRLQMLLPPLLHQLPPDTPTQTQIPVDYDVRPDDDDKEEWTQVTGRGRKVYKPKRALYENTNILTTAESNYYKILSDFDDFDDELTTSCGADICHEIATVGAGVGGGFDHTSDLHVMKYDQAMKSKDKNE